MHPIEPSTGIRQAGTTEEVRIPGPPALQALADALPILLGRDDERPVRWATHGFTTEVAAVRTRLSPETSLAGISRRYRIFIATTVPDPRPASEVFDADHPPPGRFESAASRLAADWTSVAFAIRWIEIEADLSLPSWPELLQGRAVLPALVDSRFDPTLWFG